MLEYLRIQLRQIQDYINAGQDDENLAFFLEEKDDCLTRIAEIEAM